MVWGSGVRDEWSDGQPGRQLVWGSQDDDKALESIEVSVLVGRLVHDSCQMNQLSRDKM